LAEQLFRRPAQGEACGIAPAATGMGAGVYLPQKSAGSTGGVVDAFYAPLIGASPQSPLRVQHRRTAREDRLFVFNDSDVPVREKIRLCCKPVEVEIGMPESGKTLCVPSASSGELELSLAAYGGVVICVSERCSSARHSIPSRIDVR